MNRKSLMNFKKSVVSLVLIASLAVPSTVSAMSIDDIKSSFSALAGLFDIASSMGAQVIDASSVPYDVEYDVNQDGMLDIWDLVEVESSIISANADPNYFLSYADLNKDKINNNEDFFILRNYFIDQGATLIQYDVNKDEMLDVADLEEIEGAVQSAIMDPASYNIFADLDQDETNTSADYFILRNYFAAQGDTMVQYDVNKDGVLDGFDLDEIANAIASFDIDPSSYQMVADLDQDGANTSADYFMLRNFFADDGNVVGQYDVNLDDMLDVGDLDEIDNAILSANADPSFYMIAADLDQDGVNNSADYFMLRNYFAAEGDTLAQYDTNQDGIVDAMDLEEIQTAINSANADPAFYQISADLDQDGVNNQNDYDLLEAYLISIGEYEPPVPEETLFEVTAPNGGESVLLGDPLTVEFTIPSDIELVTFIENVRIYLKKGNEFLGLIKNNNGYQNGYTTWEDSFYMADGKTFQAEPGDDYKIWIGVKEDRFSAEDQSNQDLWSHIDESDDFFSIETDREGDPVKSIDLTFPNNGEELVEGEEYEITWDSNRVEAVSLAIGQNGTTWIAENVPNTGSYTWTADRMGLTDSEFKMYVVGLTSGEDGEVNDFSDVAFTIVDPILRSIEITSPNGGEEFTEGDTHTITWESTKIDKVTIGISPEEGEIDWIVNSIENEGSYEWAVSKEKWDEYSDFKIYIIGYEADLGSVQDYSDEFFTIFEAESELEPPEVIFSYPQGVLRKNTKRVWMVVRTDVPAKCRYSRNKRDSYEDMKPFRFSGRGRNDDLHAQRLIVKNLTKNKKVNIYVKCKGSDGAVMEENHIVSFSLGEIKKKSKRDRRTKS